MPDDGNCTATMAHLDPFERGEMPPCDSAQPQTCQVGDLAGKHGAITTSKDSTSFSTDYTDDFTAVCAKAPRLLYFLGATCHCAYWRPARIPTFGTRD